MQHVLFWYVFLSIVALILSCSVSVCVTCISFVHSYILFDVCSLGNDSDVDLDRKEDEREKTPKRPRVQKTEKTPSTKETEQVSGAKNPIISVVLTAHEAIPGNENHWLYNQILFCPCWHCMK